MSIEVASTARSYKKIGRRAIPDALKILTFHFIADSPIGFKGEFHG